ncbi:MAG: hypothetical protein LBI35_09270 [Burkholderiales bacterium]|nr:hypothetical protein [Burkholderiales bacterium]
MTKAVDIPLDLSKGSIAINTSAGSYTVGGGAATLFDAATDHLVISLSETGPTVNTIAVTGSVPVSITLSGVNIDVRAVSDACAFDMTGATVSLTIAGTNTLKSGYGRAGLQVPSSATLTIDAASAADSLTSIGGFYGAGIGGGDGSSSAGGNITLNGGTVNAQGGFQAAGIGGGRSGAGGNITINSGLVNAQGSTYGAGIGGGHGGSGQNTALNGGTINAQGGFYAAGIGGGANSDVIGNTSDGAGGTIVISGGKVSATGGVNDLGVFGIGGGAGIGSSGNCGVTGNITVTGDAAVEAIGGAGGGAGIGTGGNDGSGWQAGRIVITGKIISTGMLTAKEVKAIGSGDYGEYGQGSAIGFGGVNEGGSNAGEGIPIPYETTVTYHAVTVSANAGGAITAFPVSNNPAQIPSGANQTFKIAPNAGYKIVSVTVDDVNVGAATSWTIPNITDNTRTIAATFAAAVSDAPTNVNAANSGI